MARRIRSRLTYANVAATAALFLTVSGGTAIALSGVNSVNSADIKNSSVDTQDLADGAVSRPKLRRNAVDASRVADNSLSAADIDERALSSSAKKLRFKARQTLGRSVRLASVGPYVFRATCSTIPFDDGTEVELRFEGPDSQGTESDIGGNGDGLQATAHLLTGLWTPDRPLIIDDADSGNPVRHEGGTIILESGGRVVTIQFAAAAIYNGGAGRCTLDGTATLGV
jgi:hypothetical protein